MCWSPTRPWLLLATGTLLATIFLRAVSAAKPSAQPCGKLLLACRKCSKRKAFRRKRLSRTSSGGIHLRLAEVLPLKCPRIPTSDRESVGEEEIVADFRRWRSVKN